jgi:hypothetical protein
MLFFIRKVELFGYISDNKNDGGFENFHSLLFEVKKKTRNQEKNYGQRTRGPR